jgi:hypothetical protein
MDGVFEAFDRVWLGLRVAAYGAMLAGIVLWMLATSG